MSDVDTMNGHAFEHYVARLLTNEGFAEVTVTQGSGDYGVDILASRGQSVCNSGEASVNCSFQASHK